MELVTKRFWACLCLCCLSFATSAGPSLTPEFQGGWNPDRYLEAARVCAETILRCASDHYGSTQTSLWIGIIDPKTEGLLEAKPPNWQKDWDAEDYILTAQGCNLYRDMPTLDAFYRLSQRTGDPRYRDAADAYLRFYLADLPSPATGLFPWGEHMSYNVVRDRIVQTRHELERNLPQWEMLWRLNPEAVTREIEAIRRICIYDEEGYVYDRHAHYYTGEFDPLPVRGAYIKHSGLFAYSFMFLYTKTHDPKHLEWARKISEAYWRHRDPVTQLLPGYISLHDAGGPCNLQPGLAYYVLRSVELYRDPFVEQLALAMLDSYLRYGWNASEGVFAQELDPATGKTTVPGPSLWVAGEMGDTFRLLACLEAYRLTRNGRYLEPLRPVVERFAASSPPEEATPELAALWLNVLTKAYRATGESYYLAQARRLSAWAVEKLVRDGLILESANGYVYQAKSRPGMLLQAWLDLYEIEEGVPLHWTAPEHLKPGETANVIATVRAAQDSLRLTWRFRNGAEGSLEAKAAEGKCEFAVPVAADAAQGPLEVSFTDAEGTQLGNGTLLVTRDAHGPAFTAWELPKWSDRAQPIHGRVRIEDPAGVLDAECRYAVGDGKEQAAPCTATEDGWYAFRIPPAGERLAAALRLRVAAHGNPDWPVESVSQDRAVLLSDHSLVGVSGEAGTSATVPVVDWNLEVRYEPFCQISDAFILLDRLPENPETQDGLPTRVLSPFFVVRPDNLVCAGTEVKLRYAYAPDAALEVLGSSIAAYQWKEGRWRRALVQETDAEARQVTFLVSNGGTFVVAGEGNGLWRRTFSGALLASPAAARISADGRLAIILSTGPSDGILYSLDADGSTLWTYDADAAQSFPAVADFDGDGLDEVVVGSQVLTVLGADGTPLWKVEGGPFGAPVVGDLDGDGRLDVAACNADGDVTACAGVGKLLWRSPSVSRPAIPALARLDGSGLAVVVGGAGAACALSDSGQALWQTPLPGQCVGAPAVADLDGDGADECAFFSRNDTDGVLTVVGAQGRVLWTVPVTRESDWSPMIADLRPSPGPEVIVQDRDLTKLAIYDASGHPVGTVPVESRITMTPVPLDADGDDALDLLLACNESRRIWAIGSEGTPLWTHTPVSINLGGAKVKGGGSLLVADIDGDGKIEVVGGDDETWLNAVRTEIPCARYTVLNGQYHKDARHSGNYSR